MKMLLTILLLATLFSIQQPTTPTKKRAGIHDGSGHEKAKIESMATRKKNLSNQLKQLDLLQYGSKYRTTVPLIHAPLRILH